MFNFIRESRVTQGDLHSITLEISEDIYQTFYGDLSEDTAQDILTQYLKYRQDDGRASDIKVKKNKGTHTVNIYANLHYLGNDKTEQESFV